MVRKDSYLCKKADDMTIINYYTCCNNTKSSIESHLCVSKGGECLRENKRNIKFIAQVFCFGAAAGRSVGPRPDKTMLCIRWDGSGSLKIPLTSVLMLQNATNRDHIDFRYCK